MKIIYSLLISVLVYFLYKICLEERFENVDINIKKDIFKMLKFIDEIFTKNNIWYVSAYGTLLGGIRHWGLIPWDDDGDLLILRKDVDKILSLKNQFNENGFEIDIDWKLIKIYPKNKKYPFVDLFINEDVDNKFLRCMTPFNDKCYLPPKNTEWWWKWVGYPSDWVLTRKRIKFEDFELYAPIESEKLLKFWYGNEVLTKCKTPEINHITGKYEQTKEEPCKDLPRPQI